MVVLKKIRGSTLMETLVATVLIVVIFMIASMILNQLFSKTIQQNTRAIEAHLNELEYLYVHGQLLLPYADDYKDWEVEIVNVKDEINKTISVEATNINTKKTITKTLLALP